MEHEKPINVKNINKNLSIIFNKVGLILNINALVIPGVICISKLQNSFVFNSKAFIKDVLLINFVQNRIEIML